MKRKNTIENDQPNQSDSHINDQVNNSLEIKPERFWRKLARFSKRAGRSVLEKALILFYVSQSDHVPKRIKLMIYGALGYFISTIDAIPDVTPLIGFTDDLAILVAAVGVVAAWVNPSIQAKVDSKLEKYFGKNTDNSIQDSPKPSSKTEKQAKE